MRGPMQRGYSMILRYAIAQGIVAVTEKAVVPQHRPSRSRRQYNVECRYVGEQMARRERVLETTNNFPVRLKQFRIIESANLGLNGVRDCFDGAFDQVERLGSRPVLFDRTIASGHSPCGLTSALSRRRGAKRRGNRKQAKRACGGRLQRGVRRRHASHSGSGQPWQMTAPCKSRDGQTTDTGCERRGRSSSRARRDRKSVV